MRLGIKYNLEQPITEKENNRVTKSRCLAAFLL